MSYTVFCTTCQQTLWSGNSKSEQDEWSKKAWCGKCAKDKQERQDRLDAEQRQRRWQLDDEERRKREEGKRRRQRIEDEERQRRQQERMEKQKAEHEQRMKELENADKERKRKRLKETIDETTNIINKTQKTINKGTEEMKELTEVEKHHSESLAKLDEDVKAFDDKKKSELAKVEIEQALEVKFKTYEKNKLEIEKAIIKTGQHADNVGRFLTLTLGLTDATMSNTADANKLDAALSAFGEMINNECHDKLSIEHYFNDKKLEGFISILHKEKYYDLEDLKCDNETEFNQDILPMLEKGIALQSDKQLNDAKDEKEETEKEPIKICEELLKKWGLSQYFKVLTEEGWDDPDDWNDATMDDLLELKFKKPHAKRFIKKCSSKQSDDALIKGSEQRKLKDICLKPETWKQAQNEKANIIKQGLMKLSPVLSDFFGKMHSGINDAEKMLSYGEQLNVEQLKAIKMSDENDKTLKAIEMRRNDNDQRKNWKKDSEVEVYSDSQKKWYDAKVINITFDEEGEWLEVEYCVDKETKTKQVQRGNIYYLRARNEAKDEKKDEEKEKEKEKETDNDDEKNQNKQLMLQCNSLTKAAIIKISVTDTMAEFFESQTTLRGLTLAVGVENCCERIINGQGQIRQSVLLAKEILKLKPANMPKETQILWDTIDEGITQIFQSAMEMVKVAAKYFAFFLMFRSSFQYFIACNQENKDVALFTSLERLKKSVREFNVFTANFSKAVDDLSNKAMECIGNCVKKQIGADSYEKARDEIEKSRTIWLKAKGICDQKALELDNELDKMKKDRIEISAKCAKLEYQKEALQQRIDQDTEYLKGARSQLTTLKDVLSKV